MPESVLRSAAGAVASARAGIAGIVAVAPKAAGADVRARLVTEARLVIEAVERSRAAGFPLMQPDSQAALDVLRHTIAAMTATEPPLAERDAQVVGFIDLLRPAVEVIHRRLSERAIRLRRPGA